MQILTAPGENPHTLQKTVCLHMIHTLSPSHPISSAHVHYLAVEEVP